MLCSQPTVIGSWCVKVCIECLQQEALQCLSIWTTDNTIMARKARAQKTILCAKSKPGVKNRR